MDSTHPSTGADTVTLSRQEYEDLIDSRDHAIVMRRIAEGGDTFSDAEVDAYLAAPTPLAFYRAHRGLTQVALAEQIGITQPSLAQAESGKKGLSAKTYAKLAQALRVRMEDLLPD